MRLANKVAIVTGAGSRGPGVGTGKAISTLFAREGCSVLLVDREAPRAEETLSGIQEEGGEASVIEADVTKSSDCGRIVGAAIKRYGRLDILVNNVGITLPGTVVDVAEEVWDQVMDVNLKSMMLCSKYSVPRMQEGGGGSIINVSSIYGLIGSPTSTAYHAAKGAIRLFTKSAAVQYAKENIRVNSVHPGYAHTPLTDAGYSHEVGRAEWCLERIPIGRLGNAYDIAYGILYLASDESSFVTGAELVIDGGTTAQ